MNNEEFQKYIDNRFKPALVFYDKRARQNKVAHYLFSVYLIVVSGVVAAFISESEYIIAYLAASVPIAAGVGALFQFQQHWISYRTTWDALNREQNYRLAQLDEYNTTVDCNSFFVRRIESLLASEGKEWSQRNQSVDQTLKDNE